ncbi:MAG: hypothetical protein NXI24_10810 [bacterium]|nr:hypothetical protein [bacterium]
MQRFYSLLLIAAFTPLLGQTGWPDQVQFVDVAPNTTAEVSGDLSQGSAIENLRWASRSSVACFPATKNKSFRGSHVLYAMRLPAYSVLKITATPAPGVDVNLYAYSKGTSSHKIPPGISRVVSCEASYNFGRPNPGEAQAVQMNAIRNPYNVVVGVAGPAGAQAGGFRLKFELKTREAEPTVSGTVQVTDVASKAGQTVEVTGNLASGQALPLRGWADSSQVACFPTTQFEKFRGHHVMYRTQLPPNSTIEITAVPKDPSLDLSLYAVRLSSRDRTSVPPKISRGVCEASLDYRDPQPGKSESVRFMAIRNGYNILIGVAAPKGVTSGAFTLQIKVTSR